MRAVYADCFNTDFEQRIRYIRYMGCAWKLRGDYLLERLVGRLKSRSRRALATKTTKQAMQNVAA